MPDVVSLSHFWSSFPADRILYEDDDVIVIDKPVNTSTHAPDAGKTDDAVSRLKLCLAERDRVPLEKVYLGIHQRLDRDTSGALLFTRQKSANAEIAAQFEQRRVTKTYLAGVEGWKGKPEKGTLVHLLAPGDEGKMRVVPPHAKSAKGQKAVTHYRVLRRVGTRALLELSPETGRTHQIRVQIAAVGAKIAGDRMYGNEPGVRLMLHAAKLQLKHPTSGKALEVCAPVPAEFERWLANGRAPVLPPEAQFASRLAVAIDARWALGRADDTSAFRLANAEGDGLLGVAVDAYGDYLVAHFFSPEALAQKEAILDALFELGPRGVYLKVHPKQSNTLVDPRTESLAPSAAVRGESAPDPLIVSEAGLSYRVRLGDGLKTGIFLDQRENRRRVRDLSAGKRVLNLFAYTCPFTVAAAAGGARETVSIDASKGVLAWGIENLVENGVATESHTMIDEDALVWLKLAGKRQKPFDLVVLDPPSYASTKTSRFSLADDLPELASLALSVLAKGGRMLACTNHRKIPPGKFRRQLYEAGRLAQRTIVQIKDLPAPTDFPAPMDADVHLKSVLVTVE